MRLSPLLHLFVVVVTACAHTPDPGLRMGPSLPAGATTEVMTARDGTKLFAIHWAPAAAPRGLLVIMHGLKDYSEHYAAFAKRLTDAGYGVYAFDLRGHGRSAGPRVAPDPWLDYVDDLDRFLTSVEAREPGFKVFLFGHSMGGAIATLAAIRHKPQLAGLVLSGPALTVDASPLLIAVTRMAGALSPNAPVVALPNKNFSSDPAVTKAMDADPLISQPPGPARTAAGLVDGMRLIWANIDQLTLPLLALHGTRDLLTAPSGSRALIRAAPSADKTLRIYDGLFHDLLHEPKSKQVEDDIVAWLDGHTGGTAVTAPPIYEGHLGGDPRGWTQAVELAGGVSNLGGTLRFGGDLAIDLARPRPIGWHGAITARRVNAHYAVALRPLGIAFRAGGMVFGLSGGAALVSDTKLALSAGAWFELPLGQGPAHLGIRAEGERPFGDNAVHTGWLIGSLRFGGERRYWPGAQAGVGPIVSGGVDCADASPRTCGWVLLLGLQLYGVD